MKRIIILGSTGSIGKNTLDVIRHTRKKIKVVGISIKSNVKEAEKQIKEFNPKYVGVLESKSAEYLQRRVKGVKILQGEEGILSLLKKKVDLIVNAVIGSSGLKYTYYAIKNGLNIALANKESLVMAGKIIINMAKRKGVKIIPIDSEHSAIFHLLLNHKPQDIEKIILTASGGPFRTWRKIDLNRVTPIEALRHPVWRMGNKITIDSATMINKGFEVIEAHHLFNIPYDKIDVVIHPQSIIHSMIKTIDGEIYAQMSPPDMRYPILNALFFPEKVKNPFKGLDISKIKKITFERPDYNKFPLLRYSYDIGKKGGNLPAALTVADDIAVDMFLKRKIKFNKIFTTIKNIVESVEFIDKPNINDIFKTEQYILDKYGKEIV